MNFLLPIFILLALCLSFSLFVYFGRIFGYWQAEHEESKKIEVITVAEGAVFGLLGLLIAFTFTSAYERFEARKVYIIEEVNSIDTAYDRVNMLLPETQPYIKELFKQYVDARINVYKTLDDFDNVDAAIVRGHHQRQKLWEQVLLAAKKTNDPSTTQLLIPAVNTMFETAEMRLAVTKIHPPLLIFGLLIGLAFLSSFLAGYTSARKKTKYSVHLLSYVFMTAFTIFIIIDLEMPRSGLMRINAFDHLLIQTQDNM